MTTKKQAKAQAQRRAAQYERRAAEREEHRRHIMRIVSILVIAGLLLGGGLAVLLVALHQNGQDSAASTDASSQVDGDVTDQLVPDPALAEGRTWTAVVATSEGDITLELDGAAAPQAVASFVNLARQSYFDQTDCHRLTTDGIFVIQCGDPTGTGAGGPGYSFGPIENAPEDDVYPAGTLAMARRGGDAQSMGSQFFLVYEDSTIPSDAAGGYTVFGRVVDGMDIVDRVARAGTITGGPDGQPALSLILNEVSVS
ncbi:peptidylprolyl isomerase [Demequina pelophila]|uniref:peptidylprolyl isomerase n=1 Tax=Demequina pelophila TaxID=1638984 RepID=UPI000784DFAD|nr:peptidylprolyl isomerase [Demequina pelophila]